MMSRPSAFSLLALALTARVNDGWIFRTRSAMRMATPCGMRPAGPRVETKTARFARSLLPPIFLFQRRLHAVGHQARDVAAELRHFLDQRRRDVEVLLAGHEEDGFDLARAKPAVHVRE